MDVKEDFLNEILASHPVTRVVGVHDRTEVNHNSGKKRSLMLHRRTPKSKSVVDAGQRTQTAGRYQSYSTQLGFNLASKVEPGGWRSTPETSKQHGVNLGSRTKAPRSR